MTSFFYHAVCKESDRYPNVPVPDYIFAVPNEVVGEHFYHLPRFLSFDRGHDWNRMPDGRIRLAPSGLFGYTHLVFVYGNMRCACGTGLGMGSRFCMMCGRPTESVIRRLEEKAP